MENKVKIKKGSSKKVTTVKVVKEPFALPSLQSFVLEILFL